jgi:hypothetical protein
MTGKYKVDQWLRIVKQADGHKFKLDEEVYVCKVCKHGYLCSNGKHDWMVSEDEAVDADTNEI